MKLTENIFWYPWQGHGNNCNSYVLKSEKTILIDPGHIRNEFREDCLGSLTKKLKADGFSLEDIDMVLCTHGHPDHYESASFIREKSKARVAIHKDEEPMLQAMASMFGLSGTGADTPDIMLDDGELKVGDIMLKVIKTPGHSPGSSCFYYEPEQVLFSGDTIFRSSIGRTDLPGGDMKTMGESVDKLAAIEGIRLLLPGHMDAVEGEENVKRNFDTIKNFFFR